MARVPTSDGIELDVIDAGNGRPVVLVAGFTAPATSWELQVPALLDAGHRVITVDRRSHGESDSPDFGHRMSRHGKDLHDVLTALDLRDAALVGGSMGASTIWSYLDLFGTERTRGMVSIDQTPRMVNGDGWGHGFYGLTRADVGTFFDDGIPIGPDLRAPVPPELMPLLRDHAAQDWRDVVGRLEVPVLMVAGRDSQFWPCAHAEATVYGNHAGRAVVLDDCGHAANLDQAEAFNAALLGFLGDL